MLILQASDKRASKLKLKMQEGESDKAEVGEEDEEDSWGGKGMTVAKACLGILPP